MSKTAVRRVLFRSFWAVIGLVIAVSLFKLAFTGSTQDTDGAPLTPTGQIPPEEVVAEKGTISNSLTIDGTIVIDKPVSAASPVTGVLAHKYAETGTKVRKGEKLFQVRTEDQPAEESVEEPVEESADKPGTADEARGDGDGEDAPVEPTTPTPVYHWYTVVAPATGIAGNYATEMMGEVAEDGVVVSIRPTTFHAVGAISPLDRYRLAGSPEEATVTIEGGPKPFTCTRLSIGDAATETITSDMPEGEMMEEESGGGESGAGSRISCLVPQNVTVFDGLTMTMDIDAGESEGEVVTIPVTAVTGLVGEGSVWVVGEDGTPTEQPVKLGVTDGKIVEVTSGLKAGDSVLRYVPGSKESGGTGDEMAEKMPVEEM
ncbi:efflux RND transporter periplasmic adaptor subunit [Nocardioides sp. CCNWLW239]|uniref:efflux RND transporter periplasmic adaptor subunit n=1 Tax=Nocardioides sp. CCNWLW239 TaxID=3128902 RepID=UPI0030198C79